VLARVRGSQAVVLPRIESQRRELLDAGGFIVPEHAIDAQSLIAYADLVISAGGTMNREAVALGTPVWTTFEGRLGAVDERLIAQGRMRAWSAPSRSSFASAAARAASGARVRRDPAVLVALLESAASPRAQRTD
jgi:predicted glycosyltransferase